MAYSTPLTGRGLQTGTGRVRCRLYPFCSLEDLAMRTYDFSPLWRSTIGFDRLFDLVETAQQLSGRGHLGGSCRDLQDLGRKD